MLLEILYSLVLFYGATEIDAYTRWLYTLKNFSVNEYQLHCSQKDEEVPNARRAGVWQIITPKVLLKDPYRVQSLKLNRLIFGPKIEEYVNNDEEPLVKDTVQEEIENELMKKTPTTIHNEDPIAQYPNGQILRAELFNNKSGVHFPPREFLHKGHAQLHVSPDYMQTAINAFFILLEGSVGDVERLPPDYVLRSSRTIAMMNINTEKLAKLWETVKAGRKPIEIKYHELEMYRPLFKYVNAREMARLNLSDNNILTYIGTHPSLDRHKVGVVASKYLEINSNWSQIQYLNKMNNLLCGIPMNYMRKIPSETYLQLTHQTFYHIRACEPMQRRFYLAMMSRTEALGKPFSWSAEDVSRIGLLLSEVNGPDLSSINPDAMAGITPQVMMEISAKNMQYFTEAQLQYLSVRPLNILVRKLKALNEKPQFFSGVGSGPFINDYVLALIMVVRLLENK